MDAHAPPMVQSRPAFRRLPGRIDFRAMISPTHSIRFAVAATVLCAACSGGEGRAERAPPVAGRGVAREERSNPPDAGTLSRTAASAGSAMPASQGVAARELERLDRRTPLVRTVERVGPAVVSISTETLVRNPYYGGPPLPEWFSGPQPPAARGRYVENSLGSGVIVDPRGYVVTNEHVVASASRIKVTLLDGRQVAADFVGSASEYDLAVLELEEAGTYPFLSVDFAETLHPGETVIAIGNPFGLQSSVTAGILSGMQRRVESGGSDYTDFLQTDAAINPGSSGGALLTINGDLIGINTQILAGGQNLGFAIPVARVRKVFDELVRYGEVKNVWLGADAESLDLDADAARRTAPPGGRGMIVRSVFRDSPASRAGLAPGDVILDVGEVPVRDYAEFHTALSRIKVGDAIAMGAWRDGTRTSLTLRAEPFPLDRGAQIAWQALGLRVQLGESRRGPVLFVSEVREGSRADRIGFHPGLLVPGVDDERVSGPEAFYRAIIARLSRRSVLLNVSDGRATYRVPLPIEGI